MQSQNTSEIFKWSNACLAINPMAETPWRSLLRAANDLRLSPPAIEAVSALLALETPDRPSLHYQMAKLTGETDPHGAKRHVLQALEEAPRFGEAYHLLKQLQTAIATADLRDPLQALDLDNDFIQ